MAEEIKKKETIYTEKTDIEQLLQIINSVKFGSVTIIIQEGKIVQIEKNEKLRIK